MEPLSISIIVPCYNEEAVISQTYQRIKNVLDKENLNNHSIIFINDGSRDNTLSILKDIASKDKKVKILSFSRNFGHQPAVCAGIKYCTSEIAIIIDADLQDPPEIFPDMIKIYREKKCNVVYAVRQERKGESYFKKLTARLYYKIINSLSDTALPVDTGDFRLIDRKVMDEFNRLREKNKYIRGLISWIGFKQEPILYVRDSRAAGETKYPLSKMIKFATTGLLYFTKKPLKLAITVGFICTMMGLIFASIIIIGKLTDKLFVVRGWTSIMILMIFFGGVQLMTIGVLGEYIGSIFDEVKDRPEFIVDQKINFEE